MLTADLVRATRKGGELVVRRLSPKDRERAAELATAYLELARAEVGSTRETLIEAWSAVPLSGREKRLADGLRKLVEDGCEFETQSPIEPVELRSEVFLAASAARRQPEIAFDRARVLGDVAAARGVTTAELDAALYADLKGEQRLVAAPALGPGSLVETYEHAQVQAVLLRAVKVVADVQCEAPEDYRAIFREIKFRRLLHRIERRGEGYRVEIDGPYSLFDSVTKYGLGLALLLPALERCNRLTLVAEVRWGKERKPLVFKHEAVRAVSARGEGIGRRDDIAALLEAWAALDTPWKLRETTEVLDVPGLGLCIPDLVFEKGKRRVFFEALGFWSRDAVWKRVELVQAGAFRTPVLFAVSSRLRVSEAVLGDDEPGALYVYKGTMSPRAIERKLDALGGR